jgi:hypothetical protein
MDARGRQVTEGNKKEERPSFLKKRSKKLLWFWARLGPSTRLK